MLGRRSCPKGFINVHGVVYKHCMTFDCRTFLFDQLGSPMRPRMGGGHVHRIPICCLDPQTARDLPDSASR